MKKTYAKRGGATDALRRAGVKSEDYDKHLKKVATGFEVSLPDKVLAPTVKALKAGAKTKDGGPAKKIKAPKATKQETCASVVRAMVAEGKDNPAIWAVIQPKFQLGDDKKWYPGWYRSDMARKAKAGK